jgi:sugar O-acyltransferase (sialic acid O-acetyltransferase NeuD family)
MKDIVIIGSGGLAKEVAFVIEEINKVNETWNILGYVDNDDSKVGSFCGKYQVIHTDSWFHEISDRIAVAIGIGTPEIRKKVVQQLIELPHLEFPNLIHPNFVGDLERISMGKGNIICAGNIFTTDITLGSHNYFNLDCTLGHDAIVGDYCVINPSVNISGGVTMGNNILIGTGAQILQYLNIEDYATVGAGAVVSKPVQEETTVVGIPAKPLNK